MLVDLAWLMIVCVICTAIGFGAGYCAGYLNARDDIRAARAREGGAG